MSFCKGDRVRVNLAPFIGSAAPSDEWIECEVTALDGVHVQVRTLEPYRRVELRVHVDWIKAPRSPRRLAPHCAP